MTDPDPRVHEELVRIRKATERISGLLLAVVLLVVLGWVVATIAS